MKFNINKLTTNTQTQVIFDKKLTLNKVEFEGANQLKIGLGELCSAFSSGASISIFCT
jgi:hypothetical protein